MNIPGTGAIEWLDVHHKTILKTDEIGGAISLVGSSAAAIQRPPCKESTMKDIATRFFATGAIFALCGMVWGTSCPPRRTTPCHPLTDI